jgi:glycosidase
MNKIAMRSAAVLHLYLLTCLYPPASFAQQQEDRSYPPQYREPFKGVPDNLDVNLYQVNTRSFSKEGNFKGVTARLDSVKALGINFIYIMPVYPVGLLKATNSPYATRDYDAIGSEFGTLQDFRDLVNGAHKRKIAVMLDVVANHTSWDNPWIVNKDWYVQDSAGNIVHPRGWRDVAQLNFKNADMRLALIRSMKAWVLKANIDGFRCDYADGPPADFWEQAIDTLRNIRTHKLLFLAEGRRASNYTAGFDDNFGFRFYEDLKKIYQDNRSVKLIDTQNIKDYEGASDEQGMVRYLTNHDVNSSDGTPLDLFGGKKGSLAAWVVIAYMKGIPLLYNGQEIGTPYRLVFPFTDSHIDWSHNDPELTGEYKRILGFRNKNRTVRRGALTSYSSDDVCVFTKTSVKETILVLSNLRNRPVTYTLPATLANRQWKGVFTGSGTTLGTSVNLDAYAYMVLKGR